MATIKEEIMSIAEEQGYEGEAPQTIAGAVNALGTVMGGGGGGGANVMIVEFTDEVPQQTGSEFTSSKSAEEVYNHVMGGGIAFILCPYIYPDSDIEARNYLLPVCQVTKHSDSSANTYTVGGSCKNGDSFGSYVAEIIDNKNSGTTGYCVGS